MPLSQDQSFPYVSYPRAFLSHGAESFSPAGSSPLDNPMLGVNRASLSRNQVNRAALYYSNNSSDEENWFQGGSNQLEYFDSPDVFYHSDPDYNLSRRSPVIPSQQFSFMQSSLPRHYESSTESPQHYESDASFHSHHSIADSRFHRSPMPLQAPSHAHLFPPHPTPSNYAPHDPSNYAPHPNPSNNMPHPNPSNNMPHPNSSNNMPHPNPSNYAPHDPSNYAPHDPSLNSAHLVDSSMFPSDEEYRYSGGFSDPHPHRRFTPEIPQTFGNASLLEYRMTETPPKPHSLETTDWEGLTESVSRALYRPISREDSEPRLSSHAARKQPALPSTESNAHVASAPKDGSFSESGALERALRLKKAGRVEAALEELHRLFAKYPKSSAICFEIVRIAMDMGCFRQAQTLLSDLRQVNAEERVLERLLRVDERMGDASAILHLARSLSASTNYSSVKVMVEACTHLAKLGYDFVAQCFFTSLIDRGCLKQGNLAMLYVTFLFRSVGIEVSLRAIESCVSTYAKHGPLWFFFFYLLEHQEQMLWDGANMTELLRPVSLLSCYASALRALSAEMRWKVFYVAIQMILRTLVHLRLVSPNLWERLIEYRESTRFGLGVYYWYFRSLIRLCPASLRWKCWLLVGRAHMLSGNRRVASEVETCAGVNCSASRVVPSRASSGTPTRCSSRSHACSTSRATWRQARRCWRRA